MKNAMRIANRAKRAASAVKSAMTRLFRATLRNWLALAVMFASLVLLTIGFVRVSGYTVFMLRGDYQNAAVQKYQENFEEPDHGPPQPELMLEPTGFDKFVIESIETWCKAEDTVVGDRVAAKFNHALSLYREANYGEAVNAFNKAYAACSTKGGKVDPKYRELASVIQLLVGNAYANQGKVDEAVAAYQLSLTFDPNNLITIYNLERLLANGGGKGGDKGDKPQGKPLNDKI